MTAKSDEDKLRKRIVSALRNLLTKADSQQIVKLVHGVGEFGIDIEYYAKDFSGQLHCYGMQVKAGDLTCNGKLNAGVKEIIGQLAVASGKKSIHQSDSDFDFSAFYVVVEGSVSPMAMAYIRSAFNNGKAIHFLNGEVLEKFLKENEPTDITSAPSEG